MSKSVGFSCVLKLVSHSGWRILTDMILFILFAAIRYLLEVPFTDFCRCVANTYIHFRNQPSTIPVFANLFTRFDGSCPFPI